MCSVVAVARPTSVTAGDDDGRALEVSHRYLEKERESD